MKAVKKLHVGCFDVLLDGWHNTDITPHILIARIPFLAAILHAVGVMDDVRYRQHRDGIFRHVHFLNATRRLPFPDSSLDAVYSSQVIQNFAHTEAENFLKETRRVLKPGGICRIAVADLDTWIQSYDPLNPDKFLSLILQPATRGLKNRNRWMYNERSLREVFRQAGFRNIVRCERHQGRCPDVERIDYRSDVMFMEGEK